MKNIKKISVVMENMEYGGATTHLINFINSKICNNYKFFFITNKNNEAISNIKKSCKKKKIKLIKYSSLNVFLTRYNLLKFLFFSLKPLFFIFSIIQMLFILKKINSDIILLNCGGYGDFRTEMAAAISSKLLRKKNIFLLIHHCYAKPIFWSKIIKLIDKIISNFITGIIFVSKSTKKTILDNTPLIKKNSINKVIYNGLKIKKFRKKNIPLLSTKQGVFKIGMLSRIEENKGHLALINSFSLLSNREKEKFKVFFIGNGKKEFLRKINKIIIAKKLKKYFKIVGYLNLDSYVILKNLDITISLTQDFEGFGYTIAESLFVGTPVISTSVGGAKELINNSVANIVSPSDRLAVAKLLKDYLKNKKIWKKKSIAGKSLIKEYFNSEKMSNLYIKFFKKYSY